MNNGRVQAVDQEDGTDLDPSNAKAGGPSASGGFRGPVSDTPPELGSIQRASIRSIKPYGVFVQMEGFRSNALVHLSQVPQCRSDKVLSTSCLAHVAANTLTDWFTCAGMICYAESCCCVFWHTFDEHGIRLTTEGMWVSYCGCYFVIWYSSQPAD